MTMTKPSDFGLKHEEFYAHQLETIEWALNHKTTLGIEAPTGSGKTSLARALTQKRNGVGLVKTKFLQSNNYAAGYDFSPLYGKDNYPCVYEFAAPGATASACIFAEEGMHKCPQHNKCAYAKAKAEAVKSQRSVLNYAYWLHAYNRWPLESGYLICDEGHQLPDVVLEWAGITISEEQRIEYGLMMFPMIRSSGSVIGKSAFGDSEIASSEQRAQSWLINSIARMAIQVATSEARTSHDAQERKILRKKEIFKNKLEATYGALCESENDWFIRSGPGADEGKRAFVCKPLTARHHFAKYFKSPQWQTVIMSATIGDEKVFAEELGIKDMSFLRVPSRYTASQKPIHCLDVPRLGMKSKDSDWDKQADEIAKAVKECDTHWSGLIHTTSYTQAQNLAQRLARRGLQDRVWMAKGKLSTDKLVEAWHEQMQRKPGSLNITPVLHEGYDGLEEKINILAKLPYPPMTNDFDRARQLYSGSMYNQRAAWAAMQICGRVRRTEADYDTPERRMTYNAIADGGWNYVKKYFSQDFNDSLVRDK
jgi:Rad3-related DNA helicase